MKVDNKKGDFSFQLILLIIALVFLVFTFFYTGKGFASWKTVDKVKAGYDAKACKASYDYATGSQPKDTDVDYYPDECDNCPGCPNEEQKDADLDGIGDMCENDDGAIKKPSKDKKEVIETKLKETIKRYADSIKTGKSEDGCGKKDNVLCCKVL